MCSVLRPLHRVTAPRQGPCGRSHRASQRLALKGSRYMHGCTWGGELHQPNGPGSRLLAATTNLTRTFFDRASRTGPCHSLPGRHNTGRAAPPSGRRRSLHAARRPSPSRARFRSPPAFPHRNTAGPCPRRRHCRPPLREAHGCGLFPPQRPCPLSRHRNSPPRVRPSHPSSSRATRTARLRRLVWWHDELRRRHGVRRIGRG